MFSFSDSPKGLQYVQILNVNMKLVFIWAKPCLFWFIFVLFKQHFVAWII